MELIDKLFTNVIKNKLFIFKYYYQKYIIQGMYLQNYKLKYYNV